MSTAGAQPNPPHPKQIVLVGGGLASVSAIETLRAEGYDGRILLISDEADLPYDRPPLSKAFLAGQSGLADIQLHDEAWYRDQHVELELGQRVVSIDLAGHKLTTSGDLNIDYDRLLIAIGSRARALGGVPSEAGSRTFYLRSVEDADRIKARAQKGRRVVLVGGGVIGLETAATLLQLGCQVTVLEMADRIMGRFFPNELSQTLADLHASRGVDLRIGIAIERIEASIAGLIVHLRDGGTVAADFLVVGIGVVPNSELAAQAGLPIRLQGIEVDAHAQTSAAGVYAAGDVATFPLADGQWGRWENWTHARLQAATAARHMLGKDAPAYAEIPWVWSDQYEFNIQVTGSPLADEIVTRGGIAAGRLTAFHLQNGRVAGATTVNDSRNKSSIRKLVASGVEVSPAQLADPAVDLKKLAAALAA